MVASIEMLLTSLFLSTCVPSASAVATEQVIDLCSFGRADSLCSFHIAEGWNKMSPAADRGPRTDHTGGGAFLHLRVGSHLLASSRLFTGVVCLKFFYFISGYNSVHLEISTNSTSTQRTVWRGPRAEVTQWTLAQTTLTSDTSFNIVFNGTKTRTSGFLAIDDVTVTSGSCVLSVVSQEPVMTSTDEWSSETTSWDFAHLASVSPESGTRLMLTPTSPVPGHTKPPVSAATRSLTGLPGDWWTLSTGDRRSYFTAKHSGTGRLTTRPDLHQITGVTPNTTEVLTRTAKMVEDVTTMREFSPAVTNIGFKPTINSSHYDVTSEVVAAVAMSTDSHMTRNSQEDSEKIAWQSSTIVLGLLWLATLVTVFCLHWCKRQRVNLYKQRKAFGGRVVVTYKGSEHRNTEMTERQDSFFNTSPQRSNYSSAIHALDDNGSRSTCFHHEDELDTDRHEEGDTCHSQDEAEAGNDDDDGDDEEIETTSHVNPIYSSTTHLTSQGAQTWRYREGPSNYLSVSSLTDWSQRARGTSPGTWPSLAPEGTIQDQDDVSASQQPARSEWLPGTTPTSPTTSASVKGEKRGRFQRGVTVTRGTRYPAQNSDPPSPVDKLPVVDGNGRWEAKRLKQEVIYGNVQTFTPSVGSSVNSLDTRQLRPAGQEAGHTVQPPKWSSERSFADNWTGMPRELSACIARSPPQVMSGAPSDSAPHLLPSPGTKMLQVSATPDQPAGGATFHTFLGSRKGHVTGTSVSEDKGGKENSQTRVIRLSRYKLENTNNRSAECVRTQEGSPSTKKEPAHSFILRI